MTAEPAPVPVTAALLVDIQGSTWLTRVITERTTVGRGSPGIDIPDQYASPQHAVFWPDGGFWYCEDLGSTNGTWLNGHKVWGPQQLARGDKIRIGRTVLTVVPA